jgi:hypothetical protein
MNDEKLIWSVKYTFGPDWKTDRAWFGWLDQDGKPQWIHDASAPHVLRTTRKAAECIADLILQAHPFYVGLVESSGAPDRVEVPQ